MTLAELFRQEQEKVYNQHLSKNEREKALSKSLDLNSAIQTIYFLDNLKAEIEALARNCEKDDLVKQIINRLVWSHANICQIWL